MDEILGKIQTVAPHLFNLLDNLIQPDLALQRHRPVRQRQPFLVEIFATICYGQQKVLANGFHTQFGLYLHAHGVKKSVIQVLASLGVCVGYDKIIRCNRELRGNGLEAIKLLVRLPMWLVSTIIWNSCRELGISGLIMKKRPCLLPLDMLFKVPIYRIMVLLRVC